MLKAAASTHGNFNKWCPELVLITVCSQETKFQRNSPKMSKSNLHSTEDKAQAFSNGCNPSPFLKSLRHIFLAKNSLNFFNDHLIACILLERLWQILCATSLNIIFANGHPLHFPTVSWKVYAFCMLYRRWKML